MIRNRYVTLVSIALIAIAGLCTSVSADMLASENLPQRAYTSSSGDGQWYSFDGNMASGWGSGGYSGWVQVDFGRNVELTTMDMWVAGQTSSRTVNVVALQTPPESWDANIIWTVTETYTMGDKVACTFPAGTVARYVQIQESAPASWIMWWEIKAYAKSGTVSGTVRSSGPGNPGIAGVAVTNGNYSAVTDGAGNYSMTVPSGTLDLTASKLGYQTGTASTVLAADGSATVNFTLAPVPTGVVSGTVYEMLDYEQSAHTVAGATVSTPDYAYSTVTDADGYYSITLNAGPQDLIATAPYYTSDTKTVTVPESGATNQDFVIESTVNGAIIGTVSGNMPGGQVPIAGADVWIFNYSWNGNPAQPQDIAAHTTTDENGTYFARTPAGGIYCVLVSAPGYMTDWLPANVSVASQFQADFSLNPGVLVSQNLPTSAYSSDVAGLPVTYAFDGNFINYYWQCDSATLTKGWVEVDLGRSIELSSILLKNPNPEASRTIRVYVTQTPIQGGDTTGLTPTAEVTAAYEAGQPAVIDLAGAAGRYVHVFQINNGAFYRCRFQEIQVMAPASYISGTVTSSESGHPPIMDAIVRTDNGSASTTTDASGRYTLIVPPGANQIVVSQIGYGSASASVTTSANQTTDKNFVLDPMASGYVAGRVYETFPGEAGIAGARVQTADGAFSTTTGGDGSYFLEVPIGTVQLVASKNGYSQATATVLVEEWQFTDANFALTSLTDGFITGTVVSNESGLPALAGAAISVSSMFDPMALVYPAVTVGSASGADGKFAVRVAAGSYLVISSIDGQTPASAIVSVSAGQVTDCGFLKMIPVGTKLSGGLEMTSYKSNGETWVHNAISAFDGSHFLNSYWQGAGPTSWLQVDLGSVQSLGAISMVLWGYPGVRYGEVWYSDSPMAGDTTDATLAGTITGYSTMGDVINLWFPTGSSGRYVMVYCIQEPSDYPAFIECGVYGPRDLTSINVASLAALKGQVDGTLAKLDAAQVVTVTSDTFKENSFYIENTDRTSALKVVPAGGLPQVARGNQVKVTGIVSTASNGERYLYATSIDEVLEGSELAPLGTINRGVGSIPSGILGKTWGTVIYADESVMYLDDGSGISDGSGHLGVRVDLGGMALPLWQIPEQGQHAAVTGIFVGGATVTIRPRDDFDVVTFD